VHSGAPSGFGVDSKFSIFIIFLFFFCKIAQREFFFFFVVKFVEFVDDVMMPPVKKAAPRAVVKLEIIDALFSFASFSLRLCYLKITLARVWLVVEL